jgi:hypothetical protein
MADLISLKVDVDGPLRGLRMVREQALPFTIVRALTLAAQDGQEVARNLEKSGIFKLRNDWTRMNTKIKAATKQDFIAAVYTDTANRKTGAPDYLERQQDGGDRVPVAGRKYLTLPTKYLFKYTPVGRPIPDNLKPRVLLGPTQVPIGTKVNGTFAGGHIAGERRAISGRTLKRLKTGEYVAFLQYAATGTLCLFVRHGGISWHGGTQDAEPWYVLVSNARIRPIFPMTAEVEKAVNANFDRNFTRAAAEVAVNDQLRGTGLTVKF